jgi:uncharacterized membrane protein
VYGSSCQPVSVWMETRCSPPYLNIGLQRGLVNTGFYREKGAGFGDSDRENRNAPGSTPPDTYKKTPFFFEFSLCLSRACVGKMLIFSIKWRKNGVF